MIHETVLQHLKLLLRKLRGPLFDGGRFFLPAGVPGIQNCGYDASAADQPGGRFQGGDR